ncbi:MAG TPA: lipid A-modifier LpxR family protein [Modicisalibacter sp.]|nr:lipid A-modifier LpxR family protein [Modicisalibacter sp.]
MTWDRWQLAFTNVWRSDEFEEQGRHDQFGSLTLSTWL